MCSITCFQNIKPEIYPDRNLDLQGYVSSLVTWTHDSLYLISYWCFIGTDTNLKSLALTILELILAFNAPKSKVSRDPGHAPFQNFFLRRVATGPGSRRAKLEVHSFRRSQDIGQKFKASRNHSHASMCNFSILNGRWCVLQSLAVAEKLPDAQ